MKQRSAGSPAAWFFACLACAFMLVACQSPAGNGPASDATAGTGTAAVAAATPPEPAVAAPAPAPAAPAAPLPVLPFDDAVQAAASNLLGKAQLPPDTQWDVVIDPLMDGVTGTQTQATRALGTRITKIIKDSFPRYAVQPFNSSSLMRGPLLLVGTFTGINDERKTEGKRVAYRICLALADLKTGKLVGKGLAFADAEGVDATPLPYYRDAPAWVDDATTQGYIRTCQGTRAGDTIHPAYIDRVLTSATLAEANDAYAAGKYSAARELYQAARSSPGGEQLRTYTGLYLTHWRLGNRAAAAEAFGHIVEQGLENKRLGMKFLFRPGTAAMWSDPRSGPVAYPLWFNEIAKRAAARQSCLEVVGHASASGPEPVNERLSLLRAEAVRSEIARQAPPLAPRMIAHGVGSRQTLIGTGRDDYSDALDRRVEFKVVGC